MNLDYVLGREGVVTVNIGATPEASPLLDAYGDTHTRPTNGWLLTPPRFVRLRSDFLLQQTLPSLSEETQIVFGNLRTLDFTHANPGALLPRNERLWLSTIKDTNRRLRATRSRMLLRYVLAARLDTSPADLVFDYNAYGRPELTFAPGLSFNISHAGDYLVIALTTEGAVGVDIEAVRPLKHLEDIAGTFLRREMDAILSAPYPERLSLFFRIWTCKEAVLKATGFGLSLSLQSFFVNLNAEPHRRVSFVRTPFACHEWNLLLLRPERELLGALAIARCQAG